MLQVTVLRRRLAAWGRLDDLDESQIARLCVLAAFHDIGKFNYGFQNKALERPPFRHGHVDEVLALFGGSHQRLQQRLCDALPLAELQQWAPDDRALHLLVAAIGHHGRPGSFSSKSLNPAAWAPGAWGDPFDGISDLRRATRRWFPAAYETDGSPLPTTPAFQHGFAGLVMLADWLGSDTSFFPYTTEDDQADRMPLARAQAVHAVQAVGLDVSASRRALGSSPPSFDAISKFSPRPAQQAVLELPTDPHGSLTVLEAETGSGKTEAALARFVRLFHAGHVDGMYFALPTRTAATQLHRRVTDAVELAFPESQRPPVILAVPGYLRVDDREGRRLPGFEVLWNDDGHARWRHRGWAAEQPKRYLAGAVVVGTIDQVLLSTLMVNHAHMRATCAVRHLLVIDEVHASDVYMVGLLDSVLRFHLAAGGHALLMSATLGSSARGRLLEAALGQHVAVGSLEHEAREPYPLLCHATPGAALRRQAIDHAGSGKRVQPSVSATADDPAAIARAALDAAQAGASVLVVRNLVRDCVETQRQIEQQAEARSRADLLFAVNGVVAPHHSRFARADRKRLDAAVEAAFGKHRASGVGRVLVATQTVEQSLDLDADLLISDLCPIDVLLQRIGRLHRHDRSRPPGYERARVIVLVPEQRDLGRFISRDHTARGPHGYGTVYPDLRVLEATLRLCEQAEMFEIPRDNRVLVERATHRDALQAIADELGEPWSRHGDQVFGRKLVMGRLAKGYSIDRSQLFDEQNCVRFPSAKEVGKLATRLGEDDRLIHFEAPAPGPFGRPITRLTLPHWLLKGAPEDPLAPVSASQQADGSLRFRYGDGDYVYDRWGLRPAQDPSLDREGE